VSRERRAIERPDDAEVWTSDRRYRELLRQFGGRKYCAEDGAPVGRPNPACREWTMKVKITPNEKGNPPGKLADAELHFDDGPLAGLKLIGFAIWERRTGGGRNVTFPARQYSVNGERRSFALLRPIVETAAQDAIRTRILDAYAEYEAGGQETSGQGAPAAGQELAPKADAIGERF
jgi:hypothetical protein